MNVVRRWLFTGLPLAILAAPLTADAQQAGRVYRVGVLVAEPPPTQAELSRSVFRNALRELGWVEGRNVAFEGRWAPTIEQLGSLAAELVQLRVDVIYALRMPAVWAAKQATSSIPIVMLFGGDPVAERLVVSLQRPGGNVTGVTALSSELIGKRLGLIKEIIPHVSRVAYMWNPTNPGNVWGWEEIAKIARTMGVTAQPVLVRGPGEFDRDLRQYDEGSS